jgi:hypothetical protein
MKFLMCKNCGEKIEAGKLKELYGIEIGPALDLAELYKERMGVREVDEETIRNLHEAWTTLPRKTRSEERVPCPNCGAIMTFVFVETFM